MDCLQGRDMGVLTRLVLLVVAASGAVTQERHVRTVEQQFSKLNEGGCLPDDVASLSAAGCANEADLTEELQCIASSVGIAGSYGFDQAALGAYVDGLSIDDAWTVQQKERLTNCSSMILDQVSPEDEGTFMLACWHQLLMSDCNRRNMIALVEEVDPENAKELVDAIADLAEGPCFDAGLKYPDELGMKWMDCASKNELNMDILNAAAYHYIMFSQGQGAPNVTIENNVAAADQLERLNSTAHCYAVSTGEATSDGNVNYALINEATRSAVGRDEFKVVDNAFVEYCREQTPASIGEFYACFNREKPFACMVLKSYDIALGRHTTNGASMMEAPTAAPTAASLLAGLLGSLF